MFFGNILASNQIDKFSKLCLEEERNLYLYRSSIPIAPLTMCDDLLVISECGYKTELAVAFTNSQSQLNYLQFGLSKCVKQSKITNAPLFFWITGFLRKKKTFRREN